MSAISQVGFARTRLSALRGEDVAEKLEPPYVGSYELLHNPGRGGEAEGAGDKTRRAQAGAAINAQIHRRAFATHRAICLRINHRLAREDALDPERFFVPGKTKLVPQFFPNLREQGIAAREREVGDFNRRRIAASARTAGGDEGNVFFATERDEQAFHPELVNGIEDAVELRSENRFGVGLEKKFLARVNLAVGMNRANAFGHHFDLGFAKRAGQGVKLAVGVADADIVQVHERDLSHARTRQRLDRPRTHAADADDADVRLPQPGCARRAVQVDDAVDARFGLGGGLQVKVENAFPQRRENYFTSRLMPRRSSVWAVSRLSWERSLL